MSTTHIYREFIYILGMPSRDDIDRRPRSSSRERESRKHDDRDRYPSDARRRSRSRSRSRSRDRHRRRHHHRRDDHHRSRGDNDDGSSHHRHHRSDRSIPAPAENTAATAAVASQGFSEAAPVLDAAAAKAARRAARAADAEGATRIAALFGYTSEVNPFGDSNVTQQFVWKKKIERDMASGTMSRPPTAAEAAAKRDELLSEVEAAKERRRRREAEKEEMERLRAEEDRLKDAAQYAGWEAKEESFLRRQAGTRSLLRIRESRERPIDAIAKNIVLARAVRNADPEARGHVVATSVQLPEPSVVCGRLSVRDLVELASDVSDMIAVEEVNAADGADKTGSEDTLGVDSVLKYWKTVALVVQDFTLRARQKEAALTNSYAAATAAIDAEMESTFLAKPLTELAALEDAITSVMSGGAASSALSAALGSKDSEVVIDFEYWQRALRILQSVRSRAALREQHHTFLNFRVSQIESSSESGVNEIGGKSAQAPALGGLSATDFNPGSFSPLAEEDEDEAAGASSAPQLLDADEDRRRLLSQRVAVLRSRGLIASASTAIHNGSGSRGASGRDLDVANPEAEDQPRDRFGNALPLGQSEIDMGAEAEVAVGPGARALSASEAATFADKYRPRKPRFFNRVKTGYDWNKYNKSHYDRDNPPPKTVQGYMFNIFYPDLLDRTRTPSYRLEPCADSEGYCIIRFSAGPPYEDVAFKIVNREWDHNRKRGYRSTFDHGNLTLNFNFKGHRYRA